MIYPLTGLVLGAILGAVTARAKKGTGADMAQWAAVFAIVGGLIGLFLVIFIDRSMTAAAV